ncbi:PilC/PilY family type IV pilus protein [Shewanella sp. MM_2022_3]|uniref:pilus assembly protein n=1 Tax=Shewanella sp. MM_2022_3 TaxID=2923280 RepID=UPI001F4C2102|nr:PilC/PilY family type IV pilus protein [Shewanella sp. MM_2022_3]MCH7424382.1 rRNA (guanine-N1)-methyltransferase [Shewanella sp. MM_2022_3]
MLTKKLTLCTLLALAVTSISTSTSTFGDDTELYVKESTTRTGARPKVLVIFDNSGSMSTEEITQVIDYDPDYDYPPVSGSGYSGDRIYYTVGGGALPKPDTSSDRRYFDATINGCNQSKAALDQYGRFTGYIREFTSSGTTGVWKEFPETDGRNIKVVDCWEDISTIDPQNSSSYNDGFPANGLTIQSGWKKKAFPYFTSSSPSSTWGDALIAAKNTDFGVGQPVTFYTDNYLRWYWLSKEGRLPTVKVSRLDIAKKAISNIINSTPTVDFGLAVFNYNYPNEGNRDGGRIVSGITQMTDAARDSLLLTIDKLPAKTNTPLCETMYEAYRYFAGKSVVFGHADTDYGSYVGNRPPYDTSVEKNGTYSSPFKVCTDIAYVIYVTDGSPTVDGSANNDVKSLTAAASKSSDYSSFSQGLSSPSYLPALASYMFNNDLINKLDSSNTEQMQNVRTYTIGFSKGAEDAAPLLAETAKRGGGLYFAAQNSLELQNALNDALSNILNIDSSFTSPSIASNNFDRTQTFDAAYYAMFLPGKGPRWSGNLKKLKVTADGTLVDSQGNAAIADNGNIKDTACTIWSDCASQKDGNKVEVGGAAAQIKSQASRTILSNLGGANSLSPLTLSNAQSAAGGDQALATFMRTSIDEVANTLDWLKGIDVDDDNKNGSTTDKRSDVMGDPLHSKPLALNFGSETATDIRIILGTNQGVLHMFKDAGESVSETWGFIPYELLPNLFELRTNDPSGVHTVYGMDSSPVAYTETDSTGKVNKAWVFVGMRRGGSSYYALDVSNPDSPSLMWTINPSSDGFADLGQTWSEPIVTKIVGYDKPVLIFGGGYDVSFDATPTTSPLGSVVYIVDAQKGTLIHSFGGSASGATVLPGIQGSIPNSVAVLDSNTDGYTDRIYASDVTGNIWRMDLPTASSSTWTAFKFASLGGSNSDNRRFFAEPVVAQTMFTNLSEVSVTTGTETVTTKTHQNVPYDAVAVGSGMRPSPSSTDVNDMFFMLQDRNVVTKSFTGSNVPATITVNNLYDVTSSAPTSETDNINFGTKLGWYYDFSGLGEKSLTAALIVQGKVYFTSYSPPADSVADNVCLVSGAGKLYAFDLHKGTRSFSQLYYELGERVPDTPQIVIPAPESGKDPYIYIIGVGKGDKNENGEYSGTINVASGLGVNKIYYHINE